MTRNSTRGASPGASSSLIAPQPENAAELSDNEAVAPNEDDPHRGVLPQTAPALETATAYAPVVSRPAIKPLVTAADVSDVKKVKELQVAVMQWRSSGYPRALTDCVGNYALGVLYSTHFYRTSVLFSSAADLCLLVRMLSVFPIVVIQLMRVLLDL